MTSIVCDSSLHFSLLLLMFPCHIARCEALELYCFLGKMPQASVQELRGVGACRLKYLQWRHAMASFIRCLTSWTIKLSSMLNHKVKSCFFYDNVLFTFFSPKRDYVSIWNCSYTFADLGLITGSQTSHLTLYENVASCHTVKEICKYKSKHFACSLMQ